MSCVGTARRRWGGSSRVEVDFFFPPALLCESQGMVTINILYSLKPSKNTIFWRGAGYDGGAVRSLPRRSSSVYTSRPCYAGYRSYLHIYKYWAVQ